MGQRELMTRWVLLFAGVGWGITIWFVIVPWSLASEALRVMGAGALPHDPFVEYWLRVNGLIFASLGAGFLWMSFRLRSCASFVLPASLFHLVVGMGSVILAISAGLEPSKNPTLIAEVVFSLTIGVVLFVLRNWRELDGGEIALP